LDFCNRDEFINSAYDDTVWKGALSENSDWYSFIAVRKKFFQKFGGYLLFYLTPAGFLSMMTLKTISGKGRFADRF